MQSKTFSKKQYMISALTSIVACLQESQDELMPENKTFTMRSSGPLNKSNQAPTGTLSARQDNIDASFPKHHLHIAL